MGTLSFIRKRRRHGFTIVELLVVIVVIGILAALVTSSISSAQDRAKFASSRNDLRLISQAIKVARENTGNPLRQVTGRDCTDCSCRDVPSYGTVTDANKQSPTSACWTDYKTSITSIAQAANIKLDDVLDGTPWGAPYLIDENEGESPSPCAMDRIGSPGKDSDYDTSTFPFAKTDPYDIWEEIPLSQRSC